MELSNGEDMFFRSFVPVYINTSAKRSRRKRVNSSVLKAFRSYLKNEQQVPNAPLATSILEYIRTSTDNTITHYSFDRPTSAFKYWLQVLMDTLKQDPIDIVRFLQETGRIISAAESLKNDVRAIHRCITAFLWIFPQCCDI